LGHFRSVTHFRAEKPSIARLDWMIELRDGISSGSWPEHGRARSKLGFSYPTRRWAAEKVHAVGVLADA
jgi:hypothetical protein